MNATDSPAPFGVLLRRLRLAAGLSQEELAERARLSTQAVSALERGVRRAPYRDTIELLADALTLTNEDRAQLHAAVSRVRRPADAPARPGPAHRRLPTPTSSFIGREQEQATVRRLLASTRLLTLTGTGGIGKTRLAAHVALSAGHQPDTVRLVELAPLTDPTLIPHIVAQALGVREVPGTPLIETLVAAIREQSLLLVLDNCEHLLPTAGEFAEALLRACPHLRILATSREALGIIGEAVWWVPSLPLPEPDQAAGGPPHHTAESVTGAGSAQLFCARAATAHPAFTLTDANAPAVAAICRRLDGIPLAIELAAARARILTPEQIAARLDARFRLLTGGDTAAPRHETLRAALDWSYDLLTAPEQRLLARLSVFAGGCDLDAAEVVCGDGEVEPGAVFALLTSLAEKSLLIVEYPGETARYRLLETVRQYARERLAASGELDATLQRYAHWMLDLAEQAAPQMRGPNQATWIDRLDAEHDNLRAVLQWAIDGDQSTIGLTLAAALYRFWFMRGHLTEGRGWLTRLLACADAAPPALRAQAVHITATLAMNQGDYDAARASAQSALALYRDIEDDLGIARSLAALGQIAYSSSDFATAITYAEETLAIARRVGDRHLTLMALSDLANAVQFQGDLDAARTCYEEAVAIGRGLGDLGNISILLGNLALVTIRTGDYAAARPLVQEALTLQRQIGGRNAVPRQLSWLAMIAREEGDCAGAGRHLEEALAIAHQIGDLDAVAGTEENLADLHREAGDLSTAAAHAVEAVRVASTLDDGKRHVTALLTSAKIAADLGRSHQAARLFGAAQTLQNAIGFVPFPNAAQEVDNSIATLRGALGEPAFSELWFAGASIPAQRALAYALTVITAESPAWEHAGSPTISPK